MKDVSGPEPQLFCPWTFNNPLTAEGEKVSVIELVVLLPVAPAGKVHW
jgi:hypothetical protein